MPERLDDEDPDALIAELAEWNDGDGVDARSWIEMAVGYSLIF